MGKVRIINIWDEQVVLEPIATSKTRCYFVTVNVGGFIEIDESRVSGQIRVLEKKNRVRIEPLDFKVKLVEKDPITTVVGDTVSVPLKAIEDDYHVTITKDDVDSALTVLKEEIDKYENNKEGKVLLDDQDNKSDVDPILEEELRKIELEESLEKVKKEQDKVREAIRRRTLSNGVKLK
jgi:hypothetical protein